MGARGRPLALAFALAVVVHAAAGGVRVVSARPARGFDVSVFHFVDPTRTALLRDGRRVERALDTVVRYPTAGPPHPLVVFAHGFALTPARYATLLRAWALAGYVVAAPVFPVENANAAGGPYQADLVNEPADIRFVITRLLSLDARRGSPLYHRVDPGRIAVAGQSDGGIASLAVSYDGRYRDRRIKASIVLSGATMNGMGAFPRGGPPLLAMQGTADPINAAASTEAFFRLAPRPKFLVLLVGASHLPPYTFQEPQLGIVERVTIAFLGHYLGSEPLGSLARAARDPGLTELTADP